MGAVARAGGEGEGGGGGAVLTSVEPCRLRYLFGVDGNIARSRRYSKGSKRQR